MLNLTMVNIVFDAVCDYIMKKINDKRYYNDLDLLFCDQTFRIIHQFSKEIRKFAEFFVDMHTIGDEIMLEFVVEDYIFQKYVKVNVLSNLIYLNGQTYKFEPIKDMDDRERFYIFYDLMLDRIIFQLAAEMPLISESQIYKLISQLSDEIKETAYKFLNNKYITRENSFLGDVLYSDIGAVCYVKNGILHLDDDKEYKIIIDAPKLQEIANITINKNYLKRNKLPASLQQDSKYYETYFWRNLD